jgi:hypothetical protein
MKTRNLTWLFTIVEAAVLAGIGLWINQQFPDAAIVATYTVISIIIVIDRVFTNLETTRVIEETFQGLSSPINNLAAAVDIFTTSSVDQIKKLLSIFLVRVHPQLATIKDSIIQRTISELEEINYAQRTPVLDEPDFYNWLYSAFQNAKSTIHVVSMDEDLEWTDTDEERKFFRINVEAAARDVELIRIFVFTSDRLKEARKNSAIFEHRKGSETKLIGKYVKKERFLRNAPGSIKDAGQGFIVIDKHMVFIDVFSEDGEARGIVSFLSADIEKYEALFTKFNNVASDLEFD